MDWFGLCLDAAAVAAQSVLYTYFLCRLTGREIRAWYFLVSLALLSGIQRACSAAGAGTVPAMTAALMALYGMSRLLLKNGPARSSAAAVLAVYVHQLSAGMINSLESVAVPRVPMGWPLYALLTLAALTAPMLCVLCYSLVLRLISLKEDGPYLGLLPLPGLFFFTVELYILETAYRGVPAAPEAPGKHLALLGLQGLGLGALLCTLYAWRRACRGVRAQAALESLTRSAQAQRTYITEAQARYEKTRAFRHDLRNHLSVLDGLLSGGRTEEARQYLQRLEAASSELSPPCRTGDPVVDVLLGEKLELAESRGISVDASLHLPEDRAVDSFDLCVIFANALDNALRGCEAMEDAYIRIRGQRQGDFYRLEFENSCADGESSPEPGTGLSNIRAAAEKYGGAMRFEQTGGRFRLDVLLNISGH